MCCTAFCQLAQAYLLFVSEAGHSLSRSLRWRSPFSCLSACVAVFEFLKRIRAYTSSRALLDGVACLPVSLRVCSKVFEVYVGVSCCMDSVLSSYVHDMYM